MPDDTPWYSFGHKPLSHTVARKKREQVWAMRVVWITIGVVAVLMVVAVRYYIVWQHGNDIRIPGVGVVRRFPCGDYAVPPQGYYTTQAFAVIDNAALAAHTNKKQAVRTLVDAVFDRELPNIRCGNPLRLRVTEAEWLFRSGTTPPITERTLADVANQVMKSVEAPSWARSTVEELHFIRMLLWGELPDFVGTVDRQPRLSDKMSPIEAVFIAMTLGRGMLLGPDEFRDGPDAYVARARERQSHPPPSGAVLQHRVTVTATADLANGDGFDDPHTVAATSAKQLLDQLGFPR
ncbi:MAG: hypothetical protein C5B57_05635 [Blastocatellia bacterium]|nr:MAG: hypothetical protein C5B57_05635 [Blastocatellia bacterium]